MDVFVSIGLAPYGAMDCNSSRKLLQAFMENLIENVDSRFFGSGVDFYERVNQRWERLGDTD